MSDTGITKDQSVIPPGQYCYSYTGEANAHGTPKRKLCPYWSFDPTKPKQENGSCSFLNINDWDEPKMGHPLLWDSIKECGINMAYEDD